MVFEHALKLPKRAYIEDIGMEEDKSQTNKQKIQYIFMNNQKHRFNKFQIVCEVYLLGWVLEMDTFLDWVGDTDAAVAGRDQYLNMISERGVMLGNIDLDAMLRLTTTNKISGWLLEFERFIDVI